MQRRQSAPTLAPAGARYEARGPSGHMTWRFVSRALAPAFLVVVGSALLGLLRSDLFLVREVVVRADDLLVAREVRDLLHLPPGANTVFLPISRLAQQAAACPRVLRVEILRELPGRITMQVTERQPVFALRDIKDYALVDQEGVLLFHTTRPQPSQPRVVVRLDAQGITGGRLDADSLRATLECIQGARRGGMGLGFTLDLSQRYAFTLTTPTGTLVRLGGPDNLVRKMIGAAAIERYAHSLRSQPEYIDVRIPEDARWRPLKPQTGGTPSSKS
jgi:hypothetical protein